MRMRGFTLIEMVMTIVVSGIVVLGITGFLELGFTGYSDTVARQRLQNQARFALEKMSREFRHAVPNSFSLSADSQCLTFYPIKYAGFYTRDEANSKLLFMLDNRGETHSYASGDRLVINPSRTEDLTAATASVPVSECSTADTSCTVNSSGIYSIDDSFSSYSVANRHYIYADNPVRYCLSDGQVTRSQNSLIYPVADSLDSSVSSFSYTAPSLQRGGMVHMDLLFINADEQSRYRHDVQVLNVP